MLKSLLPFLATSCTLVPGLVAVAEITISTALVEDAGNPADANGLGTVDSVFEIGVYEITNAQYVSFLNSVAEVDRFGLYYEGMQEFGITQSAKSNGGGFRYSVKAGWENKPVCYVSYWSAARFANWLTNGQPVGAQGLATTESGMYSLNEVKHPDSGRARRSTSRWQAGGVALPTLDEWTKAARYDPTKQMRGGYWAFPTQSDQEPVPMLPNDTNSNSGNFFQLIDAPTEIGAYGAAGSYYGTYDQLGNISEWIEERDDLGQVYLMGSSYSGQFWGVHDGRLGGNFTSPTLLGQTQGFRIVSSKSLGDTRIQHPFIWKDATVYAGNWRYLNWFGFFHLQDRINFYHLEHGFQLVLAESTDSLMIYDFLLKGWMWTSEAIYPYVYLFGEDEGWFFYFRGGTPGERWFYRSRDGVYLQETGIQTRISLPEGFVQIPLGTFWMGSPEDESGHKFDETLHEVTLTRPYEMQRTEVTFSQMAEVMNWALEQGLVERRDNRYLVNVEGNSQRLAELDSHYGGLLWDGERVVVESGRWFLPARDLTWYGAMAYCNFLSDREGLQRAVDFSDWSVDLDATGYRLPTEAEWENACRAGTDSAYSSGVDEAALASVGWFAGNSEGRAHRVGLKSPNAFGLYDMHGNLWEFCLDRESHSSDYAGQPAIDPIGKEEGELYRIRGGSWYHQARNARSAARGIIHPSSHDIYHGFRPVRTLK
jgi:formylglycine-generating enzyme required for sulfatase activity